MTILDEILDHKRRAVDAARADGAAEQVECAARGLTVPTRGFRAALVGGEAPRIIAEIKCRSPSRGEIRADFEPVDCARAYAEGGAAAISVLTDERYFGGHLDDLEKVRSAVPLPLLCKDFVVDPFQIDEARLRGADAVLLIVAAFLDRDGPEGLAVLRKRALELGLDVLVEVHDEAELDVAIEVGADLIGVNNRDLKTFDVDLATTERLAAHMPMGVVQVAESGIFTPKDIARLEAVGSHAFLVGESLMREADIAAALRRLRRRP
ncbi:MAG: indole-3-glycerol phosphate synthase TrpC [Deltaproteobacteria bacterium]|nr:indole-3-glycerol phosphate synthase TrpC [Myxococcales bacterium]MCH8132549.1 indole-3-glycerol phosphate synthase TrpC [Myxococcales bacterium]TDJ10412.1 MAG: indole-3-glycerol phosphate synthase TrpC [Deltaproteobacteria bacterium]TDJ18242.1 MAG: indole-3-glycerol phosphate synthase TrpC [Deltaproteobacteria bacterium]